MKAMKLPKELQLLLEVTETAEQEMLVFTRKSGSAQSDLLRYDFL
jgi:hypothetical protein